MATRAMTEGTIDRYRPKESMFSKAKQAVQLLYRKANNDKAFDRASGLAFQALFSIIPILAVGYFLFALSGGFREIQDDVEKFAISNFAPAAGDQVVKYLHTIQEKVSPGAIGIFGLLGFLWAGISMISKAEEALNEIWGLTRTRSLKQRLWLYTVAIIVTPIVLGISIGMTSVLATWAEGASVVNKALAFGLSFVPVVLSIAFFTGVYWLLPYTTVSKKAAFKAGLITAIVMEALKQGYAFYASWSLGDSIYGSLAVLPILFLWLSLSSIVFMLGAELCYFFDAKESGVIHVARPESHLSFPMLVDILRAYDKAGQPLAVKRVVSLVNWDQNEVYRHVHYLASIGLLKTPRGKSKGDECYQIGDLDFDTALGRLIEQVNRVKYEHLELPAQAQEGGSKVRQEGRRGEGSPAVEEGQTAVDKVWSPWGATRKPPHPAT